jgi:hypothetical protein
VQGIPKYTKIGIFKIKIYVLSNEPEIDLQKNNDSQVRILGNAYTTSISDKKCNLMKHNQNQSIKAETNL